MHYKSKSRFRLLSLVMEVGNFKEITHLPLVVKENNYFSQTTFLLVALLFPALFSTPRATSTAHACSAEGKPPQPQVRAPPQGRAPPHATTAGTSPRESDPPRASHCWRARVAAGGHRRTRATAGAEPRDRARGLAPVRRSSR
jgi:hypothetical protein